YLERKLPPLAANNDITKVSISRGGETYEIQKSKDEKTKTDTWKLIQPKNGRNLDTGKVDHLLDELRTLQVDKLVAEKPSESVLDRYGLKKPLNKAVVTATRPDKKTEEFVYSFGNDSDDKSGVYAKVGGRDVVFLTPKTTVEALQGDLQDTVVLPFDTNK